MGDDGQDLTVPLLRARLETRVEGSRRLIGRAHQRARQQDSYAQAARLRARRCSGETVNRWHRAHGLAAAGGGQQYDELLGVVLAAARALFDDCPSVGLTTVDQIGQGRRRHRTAASTGIAEAVDATQFRLGEGPCVDALELDLIAVVRADDIPAGGGAAAQWPLFSRAAEALGVRSALSISVPWNAGDVGLQVEGRALGAITLYAAEPNAFGQPELYALMFGAWAGALLTGRQPAEIFHGTF